MRYAPASIAPSQIAPVVSSVSRQNDRAIPVFGKAADEIRTIGPAVRLGPSFPHRPRVHHQPLSRAHPGPLLAVLVHADDARGSQLRNGGGTPRLEVLPIEPDQT